MDSAKHPVKRILLKNKNTIFLVITNKIVDSYEFPNDFLLQIAKL